MLAADHWAVRAVRRLEARGLVPGSATTLRSLSVHEVRGALAEAVVEDSARTSALAVLVHAWRRRFSAEFPDSTASALRVWGGAALVAGARSADGRALPDTPLARLPAGVADGFSARPTLGIALGSHFAARFQPVATAATVTLPHWEVALAGRGMAVSVGRTSIGYGRGEGGSVTLAGAVPVDRLAAQTIRAQRLPGILRHLGPVGGHTAVGWVTSLAPHPSDPWFWSGQLSAQPHPRLTLAAHRAALFGGTATEVPVTPLNFLRVLAGPYNPVSTGFENQVASGEVRYRPPTERLLPVQLYLEWGTDDAAGALDEAPGVVAGIAVPMLPRLPQLGMGLERAAFGRGARLRWYTHGTLPLVAGSTPLGHPLGGNGTEWTAYLHADLLGAVLALDVRTFFRNRSAHTLFGDAWSGRSRGAAVTARAWLSTRAHGEIRAYWEEGVERRAWALEAATRVAL